MSSEFSQAMLVIIGILFGGLTFFAKRIVDKVDKIDVNQLLMRGQVDRLSSDLNGIGGKVNGVQNDVKELRKLEIVVAVLKDRFSLSDKPA